MIKILELKGKKLWFKNDNFSSDKSLLSEVNVIRFYSAHDKGSEAFILGNVQNIYDFTFPAKAILFFWHVLINMQNILKI